MTPRERAAYNVGVEAVRQAAMVAAVSIEAGADSREIRHRAAAAALHGLADGARGLKVEHGAKPDRIAGKVCP